jgi:hypothetical protein
VVFSVSPSHSPTGTLSSSAEAETTHHGRLLSTFGPESSMAIAVY